MPKNMVKRGSVWYVAAVVNGRRISQSTGETDLKAATNVKAKILKAARSQRWDVLEEVKATGGMADTVGEVCRRYLNLAQDRYRRDRKPNPTTATNYVGALRIVIRTALAVDDPDAQPITVVDRELALKYAEVMLMDDMSEQRRRTVAATLRNARAVFARWALPELGAPMCVSAFATARVVSAPQKKYRLPPQELRDSTTVAARALRGVDDGLYAVFLLCYDLGMRAGEAAAAKCSWIREEKQDGTTRRYMDVRCQDGFNTKSGRDRSIPISLSVLEHLRGVMRPGEEYILPGLNQTERNDLVKRRFSQWMRLQGWDRATFPKAAHELRKLIGSEWYTRYGVEVACDWLGHADISTTYRYYADLKRHPDPIEID